MLVELSRAVESRDPYTRGHAARVAALAEPVARSVGWSDVDLRTLGVGGALHDIGKLCVAAAILQKPGPLTEDELTEVRAHPEIGARLIAPIAFARCAVPLVRYHHERWDGSGYPHGLVGTAIPAGARLIAIADAFDAMTSERLYRRALTDDRALAEIRRCAGSQFDPEFARAFLEVWSDASIGPSLAGAAAP
jgi:putative two-component system response regulator